LRLKRVRLIAAVAIPAAMVVALFTAAPAHAAAVDYGMTEDSVSWLDEGFSPDRVFTLHFRAKVTEDATPEPDQWRGSWRAWCTRHEVGGPEVNTACNFDMTNFALTNCREIDCGYPAIESRTNVNVMGSFGSKFCTGTLECAHTGVWRNQETTYANNMAAIDHLTARFLNTSDLSGGSHLTNTYDMCSDSVSYGVHHTISYICDTLQPAP
jgi:hypothetical protein